MLKKASETAVLIEYGRIPEQIMRQSAWKSGCILNASIAGPKPGQNEEGPNFFVFFLV